MEKGATVGDSVRDVAFAGCDVMASHGSRKSVGAARPISGVRCGSETGNLKLEIQSKIELWEAVAALQIIQALERQGPVELIQTTNFRAQQLFSLADMKIGNDRDSAKGLLFEAARNKVEGGDEAYLRVLARENGFDDLFSMVTLARAIDALALTITEPTVVEAPKLLRYQPSEKVIVLCPFALKKELDLPSYVWKNITRLLRTYKYPLLLIGEPGKRLAAGFTESEILSDQALDTQIKALASAVLVVGVPNGFTWLATAWQKKIALLYPEEIPPKRWFWYCNDNYGRIFYQTEHVKVPIMLAGLRRLIDLL